MKGVFTMLVKSFTGGVVFSGDKVLLLKDEEGWVLHGSIAQWRFTQ